VFARLKARIGVSGAVVCADLTDNLISPNDFVNTGSYIYMDRDGGRIANSQDDQEVPIYRHNGMWRVWLSDINGYTYTDRATGSPVGAPNYPDVAAGVAAMDVVASEATVHVEDRHEEASKTKRARKKKRRKKVEFTDPASTAVPAVDWASCATYSSLSSSMSLPEKLLARERAEHDRSEVRRKRKIRDEVDLQLTYRHQREREERRTARARGESAYGLKVCQDGMEETRRVGITMPDLPPRLPPVPSEPEAAASSSESESSASDSELSVDIPLPTRRTWIRERGSDPTVRMRKLRGSSVMQRFIEGHERSGHMSPRMMQKAVRGGDHTRPAWTNLGLTHGQIGRASRLYQCPHCLLAKRKKDPVPVNTPDPYDFIDEAVPLNSRNAKDGEIISMDPVGPVSPATSSGHKLFFMFKCVAGRYGHIVTSESHDATHTIAAIEHVVAWYRSYGYDPKILRADSGKEYMSEDVLKWLAEHGMRVQNSVPYCHYQNAVERDIQTVVRGASALLHAQTWLRADCWDLALWHFMDCRNRAPTAGQMESAHQRITKEVLDFNEMFRFAFGDVVAVAIPDHEKKFKFDMKNHIGIYVGQPKEKRGSLIYWPYTHSTTVRLDAWKLEITDTQFMAYYTKHVQAKDKPLPYKVVEGAFHDFAKAVELDPEARKAWAEQLKPLQAPLFDEDDSEIVPLDDDPPEEEVLPARIVSAGPSDRVLRSATRQEQASAANMEFVREYQAEAPDSETTEMETEQEATTFFEESYFAAAAKITVGKALKSAQQEDWKEAILREVLQLLQNGTLIPVADEEITGDYKIIHSTMQLKAKQHANGLIDKLKARLCACGNELFGNATETYSPTIGALAYAAVHQIAIIDRMKMCTIDTVGAYLYQDYPKDAQALYLMLPANVAVSCGLDPEQKYRIGKYLYGLPDAGRAYYKAYSEHLVANGYQRTASDPCLYTRFDGGERTYIWCHVDDTFVCSTSTVGLKRFQGVVASKFEITVNNQVNEYLGIKLDYQANGDCVMTQPKLLEALLEEYADELDALPKRRAGTPPAPQRPPEQQDKDMTPMSQTKYLRLMGGMIYLFKSRPETQTAVSFAGTRAAEPTKGAFTELLYALLYLRETKTCGLRLIAGEAGRDLVLKCYVDASYLTHRDSKSHTGYSMSFGDTGTFYSKSGKQTLVATSSTHAEMRALYSLVVEVIYVIHLCRELRREVSLPAIIFEDNQPVIDVTTELTSRAKRCKHFLMLVHYVKEQVVSGLLAIRKVHTGANIVDILTKIVTGHGFRSAAEVILGGQLVW
jgi:KUP system potassium uptake protein